MRIWKDFTKSQLSINPSDSTKTILHNLTNSSREFLSTRHRLSHQQIDALLNEDYSKTHLSEKYGQLFQVSEFIRLSDEFRKESIPFTPLKGPVLSQRLYNDPSYRYSNDLDFLVSTDSIEEAIEILKNNGYIPQYFSWPKNYRKKRRLLRLSNQILFVNPNNRIHVEIHWKLFKTKICNPEVLTEVLRSNSIEITFHERNFQVFNNELELLYLIIHGGLHTWFRLKWLFDVRDFIETIPFDPEKFIQLTDKLNAHRMVSLCNEVLQKYFPECKALPCKPCPGTNRRLKFTTMQVEDNIYYNKNFLERLRTYWYQIRSFPGFQFKLSVLGVIYYGKYLKTFEFDQTWK